MGSGLGQADITKLLQILLTVFTAETPLPNLISPPPKKWQYSFFSGVCLLVPTRPGLPTDALSLQKIGGRRGTEEGCLVLFLTTKKNSFSTIQATPLKSYIVATCFHNLQCLWSRTHMVEGLHTQYTYKSSSFHSNRVTAKMYQDSSSPSYQLLASIVWISWHLVSVRNTPARNSFQALSYRLLKYSPTKRQGNTSFFRPPSPKRWSN